MTLQSVDLSSCDREPIHIPGSIQPHGVLLVAGRSSRTVLQAAGDVEEFLGTRDWADVPVAQLLGSEAAAAIFDKDMRVLRQVVPPHAQSAVDISISRNGEELLVELERATPLGLETQLLPELEAAAHAFDNARDLATLLATAAQEFRRLTGYDRVMVYRFLDDAAGKVVAEDVAPGQHPFLHHHFPASDIPAQARALYVRNLVRVIPDVNYQPAPLRPERDRGSPVDLSDCSLRSVSPIHIQYLKNMEVGASASFSIVKDGALWGLIACHNPMPRPLSLDRRMACRALASSLARQIKSREETDVYRARVRLRSFEDRILELLLREGQLGAVLAHHAPEVQEMLDGDGVAVLRGQDIVTSGRCPPDSEIRRLAGWVLKHGAGAVFSRNELSRDLTLSPEARPLAAGVLAMTISASDQWLVIWFRAEAVQTVKWAGDPHKAAKLDAAGKLTPRASFAAWTELVHGKARPWTIPEIEAAGRLATAILNVWQTRRIGELNKELMSLVDQKDTLLKQRELLLGEVNHRVQNSLTLVSSFLSMQSRETKDDAIRHGLEEARRRIAAVSLVHRRLYTSEQITTVDGSRYIDELLDELVSSLGEEWRPMLERDLEPVLLPTANAIAVGLVLTELVINANKYAYDGAPGPIHVRLTETAGAFRLTVSDRGKGRRSERKGFGSRLLEALVHQLGGTLDYLDGQPGTHVTLSAPARS